MITGKRWRDHLAATIVIDDKGNQVSSRRISDQFQAGLPLIGTQASRDLARSRILSGKTGAQAQFFWQIQPPGLANRKQPRMKSIGPVALYLATNTSHSNGKKGRSMEKRPFLIPPQKVAGSPRQERVLRLQIFGCRRDAASPDLIVLQGGLEGIQEKGDAERRKLKCRKSHSRTPFNRR